MIAKHHTATRQMLLEGYGVEDIAIALKVSPGEVRDVVTVLMSIGWLTAAFTMQRIRNAALHAQALSARQPQPESVFSATRAPKGDDAPVGGLPALLLRERQ